MSRLYFVCFMILASACLDLPLSEPPSPESCVLREDCPNGQVCIDRRCYGDPPGGAFGLVINPALASGLAPGAYADVQISADGSLGVFYLQEATEYAATLTPSCTACSAAPSALVTVTESAAFVGGPKWATSISVDEAQLGAVAFTGPPLDDRDYTALITPRDASAPWEQRLPPHRLSVADFIGDLAWNADLRAIAGEARLGTAPAVGYQVYVVGRFDEGRAKERISAIVSTDASGAFEVPLALEALDGAELVLAPPPDAAAATHRYDITAAAGLTDVGSLSLLASTSTEIQLSAYGYAPSGDAVAVTAGRLVIEAEFDDSTAEFRLERSFSAGAPLSVTVPANATRYLLSILPSAPVELGGLYRRELTLGELAGAHVLPTRVAVAGQLRDHLGNPVAGATVGAELAVTSLWDQPKALQRILRLATTPSTTTQADGAFVLWVDASWAAASRWRLQFVPASADLPRWATAVELGAASTFEFGALALPAPRGVRALIRDPLGAAVSEVQVSLYRVNSIGPCLTTLHPPEICELPPVVVATAIADDTGLARLILPDVLPTL